MLRLCIVGASHVLALREGAPDLAAECQRRGIRLTFFANKLNAVTVADGLLAPDPPLRSKLRARVLSKGGVPDVSLGDYDAFAVVGVGLFRTALQIYGQCRAESHDPGDGSQQLVSDRCFETSLANTMRQTEHAHRFSLRLRAATDVPIALLPVPFYKESMADSEEFGPRLIPMRDARAAQALADSYRRAMRRLAGDQFTVIDQAPETLATPALTHDDFSVGKRETSEGIFDDPNHMNGSYGRIMLARCLDWAETVVKVPA